MACGSHDFRRFIVVQFLLAGVYRVGLLVALVIRRYVPLKRAGHYRGKCDAPVATVEEA